MTAIDQLPILMKEQRAALELDISIDTLQRIRKRGEISFRKVGSRYRYTPKDLLEYLENQRTPCQKNVSVKSADSGSPTEPEARSGISHGSIPQLDKQNAAALASQTFGKPKSSLRNTSH